MELEKQIEILNQICPFYKRSRSKHEIRHEIFRDIKTEIQAYLLGFYVADGNINERRSTFRIGLQIDDVEIINMYRDYICKDSYLYVRKPFLNHSAPRNQTMNSKSAIYVDINSTVIKNDLVNLNYGYRKTWKELHLPNLNDDLMRHFLRGYFDGDGSICGHYIKPDLKYKKNERFRCNWSICSKTRSMLDDIQIFLNKFNIKSTICFARRDQMYIISSATSNIKKIYHLLYDDAHLYLKRKFKKIYHYANTEITQLIAEYRNAQAVKASNTNNLPTSVEHPIGMIMCAELQGNLKNSEIKSSGDNKIEAEVKLGLV